MSLTITPSPDDYGNILTGDSLERTFTFSADDIRQINSVVSNDSQFVVESGYGPGGANVPFYVYPGQTHDVKITCSPSSVGAISAIITVDDEADGYIDESGDFYVDENNDNYIDEG